MNFLYSMLSELKKQRYDYFLYAMLTPNVHHQAIITLLAFENELAQIPYKVSEPMLGNIRFAWWREALELLEAENCPRSHPVIDAIKEMQKNQPHILPILKRRLELHEQHYDAEGEAHCSNIETLLIQNIYEMLAAPSLTLPLKGEGRSGLAASGGGDNLSAAAKWRTKALLIHEHAEAGTTSAKNLKLLFRLFVA